MAHYLCCTRYCGEHNDDDQLNEIKKAETKTLKPPLIIQEHQKGIVIQDDTTSLNNSMLRFSFQNLKKDLIHDNMFNGKTMINSQSNSVIKSKGKIDRTKARKSKDKNRINNGGINKSALKITLTNNKSTLLMGNYCNEQMRLPNGEDKIVKRVNKKDYSEDIVYGKPSNVFLMSKQAIKAPINQEGFIKGTFRKFKSQSQGRVSDTASTCDICREMYKKMVIKQEFQPLKCPNCGNILNEALYYYYLKLFSSPLGEQPSLSRYLDEGKMTGQWTKWIQLQTELKKENLAYDIVNGNAKINKQNEKDEQLKKMIATTKPVLKRIKQLQNFFY